MNNMLENYLYTFKDSDDDALASFLLTLYILVDLIDPMVAPIDPLISPLVPLIAVLDALNPLNTHIDTLPPLPPLSWETPSLWHILELWPYFYKYYTLVWEPFFLTLLCPSSSSPILLFFFGQPILLFMFGGNIITFLSLGSNTTSRNG